MSRRAAIDAMERQLVGKTIASVEYKKLGRHFVIDSIRFTDGSYVILYTTDNAESGFVDVAARVVRKNTRRKR